MIYNVCCRQFTPKPTMSTVFIAVQCCQCSTMQVKQRKKSSNKWTCVVCNEKQSVRKVFSQGFMARDVRKFVQSFNMSRQLADQQRGGETLGPLPEDINNEQPSNQKKRTDWSEYIDLEDKNEQQIKEDSEDVLEPKIVTELPKPLFRKPKLSTYTCGLGSKDAEEGFRPVFSKRKTINLSPVQDKETRKYQPTRSRASKCSDTTMQEKEDISAEKQPRKLLTTINEGASKWRTYAAQKNPNDFTQSKQLHSTTAEVIFKWSNYMVQDEDEKFGEKVTWRSQAGTTKAGSKWDDYITEEDDSLLPFKSRRGTAEQLDDGILEAVLHEERVEEDIHPDFQ